MSLAAEPPALVVFAKAPVPGMVKTRLAQSVGEARATRVYCDLLSTTLAHAHLAWRTGKVSRIELWGAPDCEHPLLRGMAGAFGASRHRQEGGDLGERMRHALTDALRRAPAALVIGTDCPVLDPARIGAAAAALDTHDAVLVPAEDGGYVLVGARRPVPFDGVRWSTPHALADTLAAFGRASVRHALLPAAWDVDTVEDLARFDALRGADRETMNAARSGTTEDPVRESSCPP